MNYIKNTKALDIQGMFGFEKMDDLVAKGDNDTRLKCLIMMMTTLSKIKISGSLLTMIVLQQLTGVKLETAGDLINYLDNAVTDDDDLMRLTVEINRLAEIFGEER